MTTRDLDRRSFVAAAAGIAMAGIAGCGGDGGSASPTAPATGAVTATPSGTGMATGRDMDETGTSSPTQTDEEGMDGMESTATTSPRSSEKRALWRTAELTDVLTDETFTIEQFRGKPVLLETFAVWCPICTAQQEAIGSLRSQRDDVVVVSLNVDPNESESKVEKHATEHGFDWYYAVSPASVTGSLVDAFGGVITTPPAAPVVRICPSGSAKLIGGTGKKSAGTLESAIEEC